jgi:hypothetical protein
VLHQRENPRKAYKAASASAISLELTAAACLGKTFFISSAQYHRLAARRGVKKGAVAVGHSNLLIIHALLRNPTMTSTNLGFHYFDERDRQAVERLLVKRLEALGNQVTIQPVAVAA